MKTKNFIKAVTLTAILFTVATQVQAVSQLVTNGDFEANTIPAFSSFQTVNAGETTISGWVVGDTSVDLINGNYGAISGNSIDMLGSPGPGSLSQTLATTVGQKYMLNFDLSANGVGGDSKAIFVNIGQAAQVSFIGDMNNHVTESINYTATSASTLLLFTSAASGYSGAVLDNVSVIAVPEPETYVILLAGLGLMGFMSRRRNNS